MRIVAHSCILEQEEEALITLAELEKADREDKPLEAWVLDQFFHPIPWCPSECGTSEIENILGTAQIRLPEMTIKSSLPRDEGLSKTGFAHVRSQKQNTSPLGD